MPKPEEYIGIQAWGAQMGSFAYYIREEQAKAAEDNAPIDSIFRYASQLAPGSGDGPTKKWATVSELPEGHTFRGVYKLYLLRAGRSE
jgi:hypothetical protein